RIPRTLAPTQAVPWAGLYRPLRAPIHQRVHLKSVDLTRFGRSPESSLSLSVICPLTASFREKFRVGPWRPIASTLKEGYQVRCARDAPREIVQKIVSTSPCQDEIIADVLRCRSSTI